MRSLVNNTLIRNELTQRDAISVTINGRTYCTQERTIDNVSQDLRSTSESRAANMIRTKNRGNTQCVHPDS